MPIACDCCYVGFGAISVCAPGDGETCSEIRLYTHSTSDDVLLSQNGGYLCAELVRSCEDDNILEHVADDDPDGRCPGWYVPDFTPTAVTAAEKGCNGLTVAGKGNNIRLWAPCPAADRMEQIAVVGGSGPGGTPDHSDERVRHEDIALAAGGLSLPDSTATGDDFEGDAAQWVLENESDCHDLVGGVVIEFGSIHWRIRRGVKVNASQWVNLNNGSWSRQGDAIVSSNYTQKITVEDSKGFASLAYTFRLAPGQSIDIRARVEAEIEDVIDGAAGGAYVANTEDFVNSGAGIEWHAFIEQLCRIRIRGWWASDYDCD